MQPTGDRYVSTLVAPVQRVELGQPAHKGLRVATSTAAALKQCHGNCYVGPTARLLHVQWVWHNGARTDQLLRVALGIKRSFHVVGILFALIPGAVAFTR